MLLFSDVLYMLVRYASPSGPMCVRCQMLISSGPVELLFLLCFIAAWTCVVVSVMLVVCSLSEYRILLHGVIKPLSSIVLHTVSLNCSRSSKEQECARWALQHMSGVLI